MTTQELIVECENELQSMELALKLTAATEDLSDVTDIKARCAYCISNIHNWIRIFGNDDKIWKKRLQKINARYSKCLNTSEKYIKRYKIED